MRDLNFLKLPAGCTQNLQTIRLEQALFYPFSRLDQCLPLRMLVVGRRVKALYRREKSADFSFDLFVL